MSKITGTVRDLGAAWAVNSTMKFTYRSAPAVASGALVFSKTPVAAKIDNAGNFSATLVMGNYDVTIDDGPDRWIISVPDDTASYDIVGRITGTYTQNPTLPLTGSVPNASNTVAGIVKLMRNPSTSPAFVPTGIWTVADVTTLKAVTTDLTAHIFAVILQPTGNMGVFYRWDAASVGADDAVNFLIIRPTDVGAGSPGRWLKMTVPVNAGGTGGTSAATARTALGVPNIDDAYGIANARSTRGGMFSDNNQSSFKITGTTGLAHGLNDFSLFAVIQMKDYTVATTPPVMFCSHNGGNNRYLFRLSSTGQVQLHFIDNVAGSVIVNITPDVALVDGEIYSIGLSVARGGNMTLYINALGDRNFDGSGLTASVAGASAINIGSGNANPCAGALGLEGPLFAVRVYNRLLTATDFYNLHRLGSPAWQEQFGSLTKYTSDFSAGADSWAAVSTTVVTGNTDGIGAVNDTLLINSNAGTVCQATRALPINRKNGTRIRVTFDLYIPNTNVTGVAFRWAGDAGSGIGFTLRTPVANTWTTYTEDVDVNRDITLLQSVLFTAAGASSAVTAGDKCYIKNVIVEYPGCVADWDFENADPQLNTTLMDKTGNSNNMTMVAASCYQTNPSKQLAVEQLVVGSGAVGTGNPLKKQLSATAVLDFASIPATGGTQTLTVTVTGAAVGDAVFIGLPAAPNAGVTFNAWVSAANTVSIRATNSTAGAIDPASATYRVVVFQF